MTRFLQDILRQPHELQRTLLHLCEAGRESLHRAASAVAAAGHVYLTGIGSSWHAAMNIGALFDALGFPLVLRDAAEMTHYGVFPQGAVIIAISRTGRSGEIVQLLTKARENGSTVIGVTNSPEGPLAQQAQIPLVIPVGLDHGISVNTYTTLAAAGAAIACELGSTFDNELVADLSQSLAETAHAIPCWQEQLHDSTWLLPGAVYYFLARGSSLGSCHEARLLWEEGAKTPAAAMGTSSFRHGPQEMVTPGSCFGIWLDGRRMRAQDLAVVRDLRRLGGSVMLIGQEAPDDAGDLVFQLPKVDDAWQFLVDIVPAQLAAERLAALSGVDCDSFRYCSYVVEDEYGLMKEGVAARQGNSGHLRSGS